MGDWAIWAALIVVVLAGIAALVLFVVRARQAWRDARDTPRKSCAGSMSSRTRPRRLAEKIAATSNSTAELEGSVERLRVSLAQLAVLRAALDEATGTVGRVTAYLPHE